MADKILLVGINAYPEYPLYQCVNDVTRMANLIYKKFGISKWDIRMLCDARATTENILKNLRWLVSGAKAGDRLLFHYSGHGTQVAALNDSDEIDGLDECICPVDFDWGKNLIRDNDIREIFFAVPDGASCTLIFDSCHSGDIDRDFRVPTKTLGRFARPPVDIAWMVSAARERLGLRKIRNAVFGLNCAALSACADDETAAETSAGGALTTALCSVLSDQYNAKLSHVVNGVAKIVQGQTVQCIGSDYILNRPFLST